jgi:hypothetical protein
MYSELLRVFHLISYSIWTRWDIQNEQRRGEIACVVPIEHEIVVVNLFVPRTGKKITLVAWVALDGSFPKPTLIVPSRTGDQDIRLIGMTAEKVTTKSQIHGFVHGYIFDSWFHETFMHGLAR